MFGKIHIDEIRGMPVIAVCCAASPTEEESKLAYETGAEIARSGAVLICGGLGGSMEAASKGARDNGGLTLGLIPTYEKETANEYISIVIPTGMGHARNNMIVATADGVIGVGGSWGTLSELAIAVKMGKPVAVLNGWSADGKSKAGMDFIVAETPQEAVEIALGKKKIIEDIM